MSATFSCDPERQREVIGSLLLSAAGETIGGNVTATVPAANEPGVRWVISQTRLGASSLG